MTEIIEPMPARIDQQQLARQFIETARAEGVELVGPGGLLAGLTKTVLETALEAEMTEHLGYESDDTAGRDGGNSRNGTRAKTVLPRSGRCRSRCPATGTRASTRSSPRKRQRRLDGIDEVVLSLTARGLTTGEVAAHFEDATASRASRSRSPPCGLGRWCRPACCT
jgi:putative transposase